MTPLPFKGLTVTFYLGVSECVGVNVPLESIQAIDRTGIDNQTITKRKYTKHKITNPNNDMLTIVKTQEKHPEPDPKTVHL